MKTWRGILDLAIPYLEGKGVPDAAVAAELLVARLLKCGRGLLSSHLDESPPEKYVEAMRRGMARLAGGEPVQYVLGEWDFRRLTLTCDKRALIPRPETEELVTRVLKFLQSHFSMDDRPLVVDVGTGSGCIAISLLLAFPDLIMTAADIRRDTLRTACGNAEKHHCRERFHAVQTDLFSAFGPGAQLICANLPYIPTETCREIEPSRYEPLTALDGGADGFELYRLLFAQLTNKIKDECLILCEIEYRQRELALETAEAFFPGRSIRVLEDLAGQPRLLRIE